MTITHDSGDVSFECALSDTNTFGLISGVQPGPPTINGPTGIVCSGDPLTLSVSGGPFDEYEWTLSDGSKNTTSEINITSATLTNAGSYTLRTRNTGQCFSQESSVFNVEVSQPPTLGIVNSGLDDFCVGSTVTLQVSDIRSEGFTFQWQRDGTNLGSADETDASVSVNQEGNYTVEVTDVNTCVTETAQYFINSVNEPVSGIDGASEACIAVETTYTATSTGETGFDLVYEWQVDGAPVTPTDPTVLNATFTTEGAHTVTLTTSYDNTQVASCSDVIVFNVTASAPPTMMFSTADRVEKCQAETTSIEVQNTGVANYSWSLTNAADNSIINAAAGTNSSLAVATPIGVDSVFAIASITTAIGCTVIDSVKVVNFPSNADIELADMSTPDQVTLDQDNFVNLSAVNIVSDFRWRPNEIMSDSTSQTVTVFPNQPSTFVILLGTDDNGCTVSSQIEIILDNLRPKRTFSPNGDGMNDFWEILNSSQEETQGCEVFVFDARGRNIFQGNAPFENNRVWDGNFNGSPVPEGVYYFVLKCSNDFPSKSGSILLAR